LPLTVETAAEATPEPPFQLGKRVNSLARDRLSRCCSSSARIARTGGAGPTRFPGRRVPLGVVRKASEVVTEPSGAGIVVPALPVSRSETPCLAASTPMTARPCRARPVQPPTPGLPAAIPAHRRRSRLCATRRCVISRKGGVRRRSSQGPVEAGDRLSPGLGVRPGAVSTT
jgi:hypothetical protein